MSKVKLNIPICTSSHTSVTANSEKQSNIEKIMHDDNHSIIGDEQTTYSYKWRMPSMVNHNATKQSIINSDKLCTVYQSSVSNNLDVNTYASLETDNNASSVDLPQSLDEIITEEELAQEAEEIKSEQPEGNNTASNAVNSAEYTDVYDQLVSTKDSDNTVYNYSSYYGYGKELNTRKNNKSNSYGAHADSSSTNVNKNSNNSDLSVNSYADIIEKKIIDLDLQDGLKPVKLNSIDNDIESEAPDSSTVEDTPNYKSEYGLNKYIGNFVTLEDVISSRNKTRELYSSLHSTNDVKVQKYYSNKEINSMLDRESYGHASMVQNNIVNKLSCVKGDQDAYKYRSTYYRNKY